MKKAYPSRKKSRWEHALRRPLRGLTFETLELMRIDLFEFLDVLTTSPYDNRKSIDSRGKDIRRVATRLAELTTRRSRALRFALKAGRVEYAWETEDRERGSRKSAPPPSLMWDEAQRFWKNVQ